MSELKNYTIEELEKALQEKKNQKKLIEPIENPNFSELIESVKEHVGGVLNGKEPKDSEHWIFEAAMTAVYGDAIFDKLRDFS